MSESGLKRRAPLATKIGLGLIALSLIWWFLYYSGYEGPFELMDLKVVCITGATRECKFFQEHIKSVLPPYWPLFWYAGMLALLIGVFQVWQARRK